MNLHAAAVLDQAGSYAHLLDRVDADGRLEEAASDGPIRVASDQDLLQALASASRLVRLVEAERAKLAGEIARRSEGDRSVSLARRQGTTGAGDLVAQVAGIRREEAGSLVALGGAVRTDRSLTGEPLEPRHPHVAAALAAGLLDPTVARALIRAVRKSAPGLTPGEARDLEQQLVERAQEGYTADELVTFFTTVPDHAHPEGAQPREDALNAAASVTKRVLDNGLTRWILDLDTLSSGLFGTALEANTPKQAFRIVTEDEPAPTEDERDRRSLKQRRVEAVRLMSQKVLKVEDGQVAGTAVTVLVHIGLHEFVTGIGAATIDGCQGTISAATARRLAAEAEIIPVVLGGRSQPLDLGTGRRYFSEAQRRAMAARDQGCAGPNCDAPLSWTQAAHIRPAGRGPTSVDNGVLLCPRCHKLLDERGWQIRRTEGRWWWTPPPWVDPVGRRRPGGPVPLPARAA